MLNPIGWVMAVYYSRREGYERIEGERRRKFDKLSDETTPYEVWIGDESKATFGNVVIADAYCKKLNESELESVFLHELGHVNDKATVKSIALFFVSVVVFFLLSVILLTITLSWAYAMNWDLLAHFLENDFVTVGVTMFISPLLGVYLVFRWQYPGFEYRADKYSVKRGYGKHLISALNTEIDAKSSWKFKLAELIRYMFYPSNESRVEKIQEGMSEVDTLEP